MRAYFVRKIYDLQSVIPMNRYVCRYSFAKIKNYEILNGLRTRIVNSKLNEYFFLKKRQTINTLLNKTHLSQMINTMEILNRTTLTVMEYTIGESQRLLYSCDMIYILQEDLSLDYVKYRDFSILFSILFYENASRNYVTNTLANTYPLLTNKKGNILLETEFIRQVANTYPFIFNRRNKKGKYTLGKKITQENTQKVHGIYLLLP